MCHCFFCFFFIAGSPTRVKNAPTCTVNFSDFICCALLWRLLSIFHIENQLLTGGCLAFDPVLNAVCLNVQKRCLVWGNINLGTFGGKIFRAPLLGTERFLNWDWKRPQLCFSRDRNESERHIYERDSNQNRILF